MFNFKLQNKAFDELNAEQFRLFYFLNSTLSMVNKTNNTPLNESINMFNGYMMDKLGLSERQVQRLVKSLEDRGYISVESPSTKRQPNVIKIIGANNDDENGDNNSDTDDDNNDDTDCDKNGDKNVTLNKELIKDNNIGFNNNISTVSISHLDGVKPLNGDSVNSSKSDSVDKGVKQQNKMNGMSDKGAIGVKSTYGSTIVEDVKPLMECRPAPAPQRSTEDDMEFNKAVDKRKDFLFNGTKCLFDFEKGFKDLAIAKENVWKFKPWSDDAKRKWTDDFNKWWVNSKPFIYKSYLRTLDYMNETLKLNGSDRFEEMCSVIEE